jgi:hypothetical protein
MFQVNHAVYRCAGGSRNDDRRQICRQWLGKQREGVARQGAERKESVEGDILISSLPLGETDLMGFAVNKQPQGQQLRSDS